MQIYIPSVKSEIQLIKYKDAVIINIVYKAYEVPFKEKRNLIFWLHQLARALKKVLAKLYKSLIYHHFKIQIEVHFIFFFSEQVEEIKQNKRSLCWNSMGSMGFALLALESDHAF